MILNRIIRLFIFNCCEHEWKLVMEPLSRVETLSYRLINLNESDSHSDLRKTCLSSQFYYLVNPICSVY